MNPDTKKRKEEMKALDFGNDRGVKAAPRQEPSIFRPHHVWLATEARYQKKVIVVLRQSVTPMRALLATLTVLIIVIGTGALRLSKNQPTTISLDYHALNGSVPSLSIAQREQIIEITEKSSQVRALLAHHNYKPTGIAIWSSVDGVSLGGVLQLTLLPAASLHGEWLALEYSCSPRSPRPYASAPYRASRLHVRYISVFVDLTRLDVVAIGADPTSRLEGRIQRAESASTTCIPNPHL